MQQVFDHVDRQQAMVVGRSGDPHAIHTKELGREGSCWPSRPEWRPREPERVEFHPRRYGDAARSKVSASAAGDAPAAVAK